MPVPELTKSLLAACKELNTAACATHDGCVPDTTREAVRLAAGQAALAYAMVTGKDWCITKTWTR